MNSQSKIFSICTLLFAGFLFVPMAMALPGSGAIKDLHYSQSGTSLSPADETNLEKLVKEAGLRLHIYYGRAYPQYYGYRRYGYYPRYRYRRHVYRPYKYKRYRYSRRYQRRLKKRRAVRRLRRLLRHRLY